jgi:hypothetical protein
MTSEEIKDALLKKYPVQAHGITYRCVTAVIYRESNGRIAVSGELLDYNGQSITIAALKDIKRKE